MDKKKLDQILALVATGIAAAVWLAAVIVNCVMGTFSDNVPLFCIRVLCAVVWIIAFAVQIYKTAMFSRGEEQ